MDKSIGIFPVSVTIIGLLVGIFLWFQTLPRRVFRYDQIAAVVVVAVSLWASGIVPEYFTAIIFFFLAMVLTDARPMVFSGFILRSMDDFWRLIIGAAVQETGFGRTLASWPLKIFPTAILEFYAELPQ